MIRGGPINLIAVLFAASNVLFSYSIAGFTSTFLFPVENCAQANQIFMPSSPNDSLFSGFNGTMLECLDGEGEMAAFKIASNGVHLATPISELKSNFDMSRILQGYAGDLFTIAIWFTLDSNLAQNEQILMEIESGLKITPLSVEIISAGSIRSGNLDPLPSLNHSNVATLMVVSVGMKSGRIYRRQLNASVGIEREFALPESVLNSNKIVMPRMPSWPKFSRINIKFRGKLFGLNFFEGATLAGDSIYANGLPDRRPKCPSIRPAIVQSAWEHAVQFEVAALHDSVAQGTETNGGPPNFLVMEKPTFGDILADDQTTKITKFPAMVKRVVYKSDDGDFKWNDTLQIRATSDVDDNCISASVAQVRLIVSPINDPPEAKDVTGKAGPGSDLSVALGGFDSDESLYEMRGGAAAVELRWTISSLSGTLWIGSCNSTKEMIHSSDSQIMFFRTKNGTGWPITVCYAPNYSVEKYSRLAGKAIVGEESFTFNLIDNEGLVSLVPAVVRIDVLNPTVIATNFETTTTEEIPVRLNLAQSKLVPTEAWLKNPPKFGHLYSPRPENVIAGPIADVTEVYYAPNEDFAGIDSFSIQIKDVNGYLSQPIWVQVDVANTYDSPSIHVTNSTYYVHLHDRTILGLRLISPDPDTYKLQISMSLEDATAGLVAIGNISSLDMRVTLGSACIDTGCQEPVTIEGFPSQVAQALERLEYAALLPRDNTLKISLSTDAIKAGEFALEDEIEMQIKSADPNVWGSTPGARGDRAVGAAIIGSIFAFGLIFGKGMWMLLPLACRERLVKLCRVCIHKKVTQHTCPSSATISKTLLNPPSNERDTKLEGSTPPFQSSTKNIESQFDSLVVEDLISSDNEDKIENQHDLRQLESSSITYSESLDAESEHNTNEGMLFSSGRVRDSSVDQERTNTKTSSGKEEDREEKVLALV